MYDMTKIWQYQWSKDVAYQTKGKKQMNFNLAKIYTFELNADWSINHSVYFCQSD